MFFTLLGAAIALYVTVVFERYKRFGGILRDVAQARRHSEGYPLGLSDLPRAHDASLDYWRYLERKQGDMDAEGQHDAAAQIGRLVSFAYRATAKSERMLNDKNKGVSVSSVSLYLSEFQMEYNRIKDRDFIRFEGGIHGKRAVFLHPWPQPILSNKATVILVDYFDRLP